MNRWCYTNELYGKGHKQCNTDDDDCLFAFPCMTKCSVRNEVAEFNVNLSWSILKIAYYITYAQNT